MTIMHKSILVLLGVLTFLLQFGPSSMNILSNAMAFDNYGYQADQYEKYAMDMANDNYNKYQSSDLIQKIKCNNINSNFNGVEANIGIDNSLDGLGDASLQGDNEVSANAYNDKINGNFDLDCINNNNNAGQGITGPPGPPGPPGSNQINSDNLYLALGNTVFISSPTTPVSGSSIATCDEGDVVFEGCYQTFNVNLNTPPIVTYNGPLPDPTLLSPIPNDSAYQVTLFGNFAQFRAFAYCLDNPPLAP